MTGKEFTVGTRKVRVDRKGIVVGPRKPAYDGAPPRKVAVLTWLLVLTAIATAGVEALNWWLADEGGWGLFVRTSWALLRTVGFLILIWQVRRGRVGAPAFALVLSITTVFALARLVVPRTGYPTMLGIIGFLLVGALCATVVVLIYRLPLEKGRFHGRGWLLTARVAALSLSPLMLVAAVVALGQMRVIDLPVIVAWFAVALVLAYVMPFITLFMMKGKPWASWLLMAITAIVLLFDLSLCLWILGWDGLIRDGGPLLVCAILVIHGARKRPIAARWG